MMKNERQKVIELHEHLEHLVVHVGSLASGGSTARGRWTRRQAADTDER